MIYLGVTGTQKGMTIAQCDSAKELIMCLNLEWSFSGFRNGNCIGCDEEWIDLCHNTMHDSVPFFIHRPSDTRKESSYLYDRCRETSHDGLIKTFFEGRNIFFMPRRPYLSRNIDIAGGSDIVIATPKTMEEEKRSGTWHTVRRARLFNRYIHIVWPDGTVTKG